MYSTTSLDCYKLNEIYYNLFFPYRVTEKIFDVNEHKITGNIKLLNIK